MLLALYGQKFKDCDVRFKTVTVKIWGKFQQDRFLMSFKYKVFRILNNKNRNMIYIPGKFKKGFTLGLHYSMSENYCKCFYFIFNWFLHKKGSDECVLSLHLNPQKILQALI